MFLANHIDQFSLDEYNSEFYHNAYGYRSLLSVLINTCQTNFRYSFIRKELGSMIYEKTIPVKVLEVGPGLNPLYTKWDISKNPILYDVIETDVSARANIVKYATNIYDSVDQLPSNFYNVIVVYHVLEHIPDVFAFVTKLSAHIAENGIIIFEVPYIDYLRPTKETFFPHLHSFSESSLKSLMSRAFTDSDQVSFYKSGYYTSKFYFLFRLLDKCLRILPRSTYYKIVRSLNFGFLNPYNINTRSSALWLTTVVRLS